MTTETEKGFENARNLRKKVFWETDNYAQLFIHSLKSRENCRKPEIEKEARGLKAPRKKIPDFMAPNCRNPSQGPQSSCPHPLGLITDKKTQLFLGNFGFGPI